MDEAQELIDDPRKFYVWLASLFKSTPNVYKRKPDFLFNISQETYDKYIGLGVVGNTSEKTPELPDGKRLEQIIMSRAFALMPEKGRQTLIKIWAYIVIESAGNGTSPSEEFIEFITYIVKKCPPALPEKAVKAVRNLKD
jgi:hypothetical protein